MISDDALHALLEDYFIEECMGDPSLIKTRAAAAYIQSHGYPKYQYESLRKNPVAKKYFEKVRAEGLDADVQTLASYTTLDVNEFIARNNTVSKMVAALTALDGYYHDVTVTALKFKDKHDKMKDALAYAQSEAEKAKAEAAKYKDALAKVKEELKTTKESLTIANNYIDSVIYDGCARQLLEERGILVQRDEAEAAVDVPKENIRGSIIRSDMDIIEALKSGFEEA